MDNKDHNYNDSIKLDNLEPFYKSQLQGQSDIKAKKASSLVFGALRSWNDLRHLDTTLGIVIYPRAYLSFRVRSKPGKPLFRQIPFRTTFNKVK